MSRELRNNLQADNTPACRVLYGIIALVSFAIIVYIALFVRNPFVRGWVGDVLVVIPIHCGIRIFVPHRPRLLPLYVFLFACFVEFTQYIQLLHLLGLAHIDWLRIVVGDTFDWFDILCYAIGCAIIGLTEFIYVHHVKRKPAN